MEFRDSFLFMFQHFVSGFINSFLLNRPFEGICDFDLA